MLSYLATFVLFLATGMLGRVDFDLLLHLTPKEPDTPPVCSLQMSAEWLSADFNDQGLVGLPYYMYIVAVNVATDTGLLGLEMGISYDGQVGSGLDVFDEWVCADNQFAGRGWPNPGGATTYTWIQCQTTPDPSDPEGDATVVVSAMYAYAYSPDVAAIVPKPSGILYITECDYSVRDLRDGWRVIGQAGFGMEPDNSPFHGQALGCPEIACDVAHNVPCVSNNFPDDLTSISGSYSDQPIGNADPAPPACRKHVIYALQAFEDVWLAPGLQELPDVDIFVTAGCPEGEVLFQQTGLTESMLITPQQDAYLILRPRNIPIGGARPFLLRCSAVPVETLSWGTIKKRYLTETPDIELESKP